MSSNVIWYQRWSWIWSSICVSGRKGTTNAWLSLSVHAKWWPWNIYLLISPSTWQSSWFFDEAPQEMLPYKAAAHPWPHGTFWVPPLRVRQGYEGFVEPLMILVPSICHSQSRNHKSYFHLFSVQQVLQISSMFQWFFHESTVYIQYILYTSGYMSLVIPLALGKGFQQHRPTRLPQLWQQRLHSVVPNGRRATEPPSVFCIHFAMLLMF